MATWQRMGVVFAVTIGVGVAMIIHYRVGQAFLYSRATGQFSGPYTPAVELLAWAVPLALVVLELGVIVWAISGGVQRERARVRGPRR
jgi:nitrogen fixation-related uncharacterized protein